MSEVFVAKNIFTAPHGSAQLWILILATMLVGFTVLFLLFRAPMHIRRPTVLSVTFLSGSFWVFYWLWPQAEKKKGQTSATPVEKIAFWCQDAVPVINTIANVLALMLLGLGVYSILRVHLGKILKKQKDWGFSLVLISSMLMMVWIGYWDWISAKGAAKVSEETSTWGFPQFGRDILFDGLLQQMDAAMFSLIAFFIFSAAYRAFRIRSVESTVMLTSALLILFSLLGLVEFLSSHLILKMTGGDPNHFLQNFGLVRVSEWLRSYIERPSIRALELGLGVGGLAIALRIWLGLDRGGAAV